MLKSITLAACTLALTGTLAFAQTDRTPTTGPAAQTTQAAPMDSNAKMMKKKKSKMKSGMSGDSMSGGGMMKKDNMSK